MKKKSQSKAAVATIAMASLLAGLGYATPAQARALECANNGPVVSGCESCPSSCLIASSTYTYYQPGYITNAEKGDALLFKGPGITSMLGIGFLFTHIGLINDTWSVRHNTTSMMAMQNAVQLIPTSGLFNIVGAALRALFGSMYGAARVEAGALYNLTPGLGTDASDGAAAFGSGMTGYNQNWRAVNTLLKPVASRRADAQRSDDVMQATTKFYRVHGYYQLPTAEAGGGSVCSGSVTTAANNAVRTASNVLGPFTIQPADVAAATMNLQATLWNTIRWDIVSPQAPNILGRGDRDDVASGVTDQVVSCFIYNQPGGCSKMDFEYYRRAQKTLGQNNIFNTNSAPLAAGYAVAPDHIALTGPSNGLDAGAQAKWRTADAGPWQAAVLTQPNYAGGQWITYTNTWGWCDSSGTGPISTATQCISPALP